MKGGGKKNGRKERGKRGISLILFGSAADFHRPDYGHIRLYLDILLDQVI